MRKLIFITFALILIGAGCGKQVSGPETKADKKAEREQEKITDSSGVTLKDCIEGARLTEVSLRMENEILPQDKCYFAFAVEKKDPSLCEKISTKYRDGKSEFDFFSQCMDALAQETNNINLCVKSIGESKYNCINTLAKTQGNPELCDKQENRLLKNQCLTQVAKKKLDPSLCNLLQAPAEKEQKTELDYWYNRDSCIDVVARETRNPAHCDLIGDPQLNLICHQIVAPAPF